MHSANKQVYTACPAHLKRASLSLMRGYARTDRAGCCFGPLCFRFQTEFDGVYIYIYMVVVQYSCLLKRPFFAKKTLTFAKLSRTLCFSFAGVHHVMKPFNLVGTRFLNTVCGVAMGYGVPLEPIHSPKPSPDFRETFAK